jgi:hypothetical protein
MESFTGRQCLLDKRSLLIGGKQMRHPGAVISIVLLASSGAVHAATPELPSDFTTPGVTDPSVTQSNIKATICKNGWTAPPRRPPTSYTNGLKAQQLSNWSYSDKNLADYEEDHRIPLEVGGHPTDPGNLWPEPYNTTWHARIKDKLETFIKRRICATKSPMTLAEGQAVFRGNWVVAFQTYCGSNPTAKCGSATATKSAAHHPARHTKK